MFESKQITLDSPGVKQCLFSMRVNRCSQNQMSRGMGEEALRNAVDEQSVKGIKGAIKRYLVDVNRNNHEDGVTILMLAVVSGKKRSAKFLLDHCGAEANTQGQDGTSPMHIAAATGSVDMVELLMEHGGNINASDGNGFSPLTLAADAQHGHVMRYLLEKGCDVDAHSGKASTALYCCAFHGQHALASLLVEHNADPHLACTHIPRGDEKFEFPQVPLEPALDFVHVGIIEMLIEETGAVRDSPQTLRDRFLLKATISRMTSVMVRLMDQGAGDLPVSLCFAVDNGFEKEALLLIDRDNGIASQRASEIHHLPVLYTAGSANCKILRMLIDAGAGVSELEMPTGWSPRKVELQDICLFFQRRLSGFPGDKASRMRNGFLLIQRLIKQMPAIHATSWLWPSQGISMRQSVQISTTLRVSRATSSRRRVLLRALMK